MNNSANPGDSNPVYNAMGLDGSPVNGFPYRLVGGNILYMTAQGKGGGTRIFFIVQYPGVGVKLYCFRLP